MSETADIQTLVGLVVRDDFADKEPRIRDVDLGTRLDYARPSKIRELISRMARDGKLSGIAQIPTAGNREDGLPSRATSEFWLTERQALKVIAKSETEVADGILDEVIDVFVAFRRGRLQQRPATALPPQAVPFELSRSWLIDLGTRPELATAHVFRDLEKAYGVSLENAAKALPASTENMAALNATAIGELVGISRIKVNKLLEKLGLHVKNAQSEWALTDAGKPHGELRAYDTGKHAGLQILWRDTVVDLLRGSL